MTKDHWKARAAAGGSIIISSYLFLLLLEGSCYGQSANGDAANGANFFYYYSPTQRTQSHGVDFNQGNLFTNPYYTQQNLPQPQQHQRPQRTRGQGRTAQQQNVYSAPPTSQAPLLGYQQHTTQGSSIFTQPPLGHFNFQYDPQSQTQNPDDDQQQPQLAAQPSNSFTTFTRFGHDLFANRGLLPVSTPQQSYYAPRQQQHQTPLSFYESPFQFLQNRYLQTPPPLPQLVPTLAPSSPTQGALLAPSTTMTPPPPAGHVVMNDDDAIIVPAAPVKPRRRKKQKFSSRFRYIQEQPQLVQQQYNPYSRIQYTSDVPFVERRFYNDAVPSAPTPTGYAYSLGDERGTSRSSVHVSMGPNANVQQYLTEITATRNRILQRQRQQTSNTTTTPPPSDTNVDVRMSQDAPAQVSTEAPVSVTQATEPSAPTSTTAAPTTTTTTTESPQEPQPVLTAAPDTPQPLEAEMIDEPAASSSTSAPLPTMDTAQNDSVNIPENMTALEPLLNEQSFQTETIADLTQDASPVQSLIANPVEDPSLSESSMADPAEDASPAQSPIAPEVSKKINEVNIPKRLVIRKKVARKRLGLRSDSIEATNKKTEITEAPSSSPTPVGIRRRIFPNRIPQDTKSYRESPVGLIRSQIPPVTTTTTPNPTTSTTSPPTSTSTTPEPTLEEQFDTSLVQEKNISENQNHEDQEHEIEHELPQPMPMEPLSSTASPPSMQPVEETIPAVQTIPASSDEQSASEEEEYDYDEPELLQPVNRIEAMSTPVLTTTPQPPPPPPVEQPAPPQMENTSIPLTSSTAEQPKTPQVSETEQLEGDQEYYDDDEYENDSAPQEDEQHSNPQAPPPPSSETGELPVLQDVTKEDFPAVFRKHTGVDGDNSLETDKGVVITRVKTSHPPPMEEMSTSTTITELPSDVEPFMRQDPPEEMPPAHDEDVPEPMFQPTTESVPMMTPSSTMAPLSSSTVPAPDSDSNEDSLESREDETSMDEGSTELDDQAPLMPPATEQQSSTQSTSTEPMPSSTASPDVSDEVSIEERREQILMMEGQATTTSSPSSSTSTTESPMNQDDNNDSSEVEDDKSNQIVSNDQKQPQPSQVSDSAEGGEKVMEEGNATGSSTESVMQSMSVSGVSSTTEETPVMQQEEEMRDTMSSTEGPSPIEASSSTTPSPFQNDTEEEQMNSSTTASPILSTSSTELPENSQNSQEDFSSYSQEIPEYSEEHDGLTQSEEEKLSSDEEIGKAQRLALVETLKRLRERQQQQPEDSASATEAAATPAPASLDKPGVPRIRKGMRPFMRRRHQVADLPLQKSGPTNVNAVLGDEHVDRSQVIQKIQRFRSNLRRVSTTTKRPRRVTRPSTEKPDALDQVDSFSESSSVGMNEPIPATTTTTTTSAPTTIPTTTPTPFSPMTMTPSTEPTYTTISSTETVTIMELERMTTPSTTTSTTLPPDEEETMTTSTPIRTPIPKTTTTTHSPVQMTTTMTPDFYEKDDSAKESNEDDVYYAEDGNSNESDIIHGSSTEMSSTSSTESPSSTETNSASRTGEISSTSSSSTEAPSSTSSTIMPNDFMTTADPAMAMATTSTSTTLAPEVNPTTTEAVGQLIIHEILPTMPPLKEVSFVIGDSVEEDRSGSVEEHKPDEHVDTNNTNFETKAIVRVETKVEVSSSADDSTNDSNELTGQDNSQQVGSSEESAEGTEVSTTSLEDGRKVRVVVRRGRKMKSSSNNSTSSGNLERRRRRRKVLHNQRQRRRRPSRLRRPQSTY